CSHHPRPHALAHHAGPHHAGPHHAEPHHAGSHHAGSHHTRPHHHPRAHPLAHHAGPHHPGSHALAHHRPHHARPGTLAVLALAMRVRRRGGAGERRTRHDQDSQHRLHAHRRSPHSAVDRRDPLSCVHAVGNAARH